MVDKSRMIDGSSIQTGDTLIGLASSGLHSNGFSLVRKLVLGSGVHRLDDVPQDFEKPLGQTLLTPTTIYVKPLMSLNARVEVKGLAHITGGGFTGNIPRILPPDKSVRITISSWHIPPVFRFLQKLGSLEDSDMFETFNMGIGMVAVVNPADTSMALECLRENGVESWVIGEVTSSDNCGPRVSIV